MLAIRLKRAGGRNHPFYRVVVIDSRRARDSRAVEEIGYYNPLEDPVVVNIDRDKVEHWTAKGAQLSDTVRTLLKRDNSVHPSRRATAAFESAPAEEPKRKPSKRETAEEQVAEGAVAVAGAEEAVGVQVTETPEAPVHEGDAVTAAEEKGRAQDADQPEAPPVAEETPAEAEAEAEAGADAEAEKPEA